MVESPLADYQIRYLVGSLSSASINRSLATALIRLAPDNLEFTEIPISGLPLYNRDVDEDLPPSAKELKWSIEAADALLFITPEYNRGVPGVLKNAIDWGSRPAGQNSWAKKPSAVIEASTGKIGTALAQQSLRGSLTFVNVPQMSAPEGYIQMVPGLIGEDGEITDPSTEEFLRTFMSRYEQFVTRVLTVLPHS